MISDNDRREVARRLRDMRLSPWDDAACEIALCAGIVCCNSECHGSDETPECTMALCDRLADLIEPVDRNDELCAHCDYCDYCDLPECSEQDGYSFKPKGYVDLLVLADKTIRSARHDMEICGDTVPAWYAAGRLEAVAQSIREILGLES